VKTPKPKGRPKKVQKNSSVDVDDPLEGPSGLSGPQQKVNNKESTEVPVYLFILLIILT